jgi:D-3-phosphoglycerate dehydrogenase
MFAVGIVNVSYMAAATQAPMKPFMQLGLLLGTFASQLSESRVTRVELKTWGGRDVNITSKQARQLLEAKVLKGLLKHAGLGLNPDLISAPLMARDNGVTSVISASLPENVGSPFWNLVSVEVEREDGTKGSITGSVFGSVPHIVHIDQYTDLFSFQPEGNHILTFRNEDRPGAIAEVLEILYSANVNVANVNVVRQKASGDSPSICFMALDDDVPNNAMKALKSLSSLQHVAKIQLR